MVSTSAQSSTSWSSYGDNIFNEEKLVFKTNIPLVLSTSVITAAYSYFGIDGSTNNAMNRALLMALSTFISASSINLLENNGYIDAKTSNGRYLEGALIPMFYYYVTKRQFQLQLPDFNSQALKTGIISSIGGELANPRITMFYDEYQTPSASPVNTPSKTSTSKLPSISTK